MERAEKIGLGIAVAGHVVLFGLLSVGFLATPNPVKLKQQPIEVSLVEDVGLEASAPQAVTPPAQSVAPDTGAPEDAAPPADAEPEPVADAEPEPVADPEPTPPQPQPKPVAKPAPAPPKPVAKPAAKPVPAPKPAPVPPKPQPKPKPAASAPAKATAKPAPAAPAKTAAKPSPAKSTTSAKAKPAAAKGTGTSPAATAARPRGSRLGNDFLKGLSSEPSTSKSEAPRAAKIDARAMAGIVQAIARQIQPCADRQVNPGPGANQIVTTLNLRLNPDGSLAAAPRMVRQTGVDDENDRYKQRVFDLGVAAFKGCAPLRLPSEYYDTPSGGWNNINFQWKLQ